MNITTEKYVWTRMGESVLGVKCCAKQFLEGLFRRNFFSRASSLRQLIQMGKPHCLSKSTDMGGQVIAQWTSCWTSTKVCGHSIQDRPWIFCSCYSQSDSLLIRQKRPLAKKSSQKYFFRVQKFHKEIRRWICVHTAFRKVNSPKNEKKKQLCPYLWRVTGSDSFLQLS